MPIKKIDAGSTDTLKQPVDADLLKSWREARKTSKSLGYELDLREAIEKLLRKDIALVAALANKAQLQPAAPCWPDGGAAGDSQALVSSQA